MRAICGMIVLSVLLFGCATPRTQHIQIDENANLNEAKLQNELAFEGLINDDIRLQKVAYELKSKASGLCGDFVKYGLGIYVLNRDMVPKQFRDAAKTLYHVEQRPRVLVTYLGSSGEEGGLKPGDEIITINDWPIPIGENSAKLIREKAEEFLKEGKAVSLKIARDSEEIYLALNPKKECAFPVILNESNELNAFADGKNVFITRGMMRFTQDDTELALVVSHEMSHNTMEHMKSKSANYILGTILDVLIAAKTGANTQGAFGNLAANAYSQEFEAEADYVSMYIMAAAGKDIDNPPKFWRRMAAANPSGIKANYSSSHPSSAYRFLALEQTVKEIKNKMAAGAPLTPEMKKPASEKSASGSSSANAAIKKPDPQERVSPQSVQGAFLGKEIKTGGLAGLVKGIDIKFSLANKAEKDIAKISGTAKLYDDSGNEIGLVSFRSETRIPTRSSIEITETVYPILFPGYTKLKELGQEAIRVDFIYESIEFTDGTKAMK